MHGPPPSLEKKLVQRLRNTLWTVRQLGGSDFSGIGLVVHTSDAKLPTFSLREGRCPAISADIHEVLAEMASWRSDFHDGFHLMSMEWKLTHVAQYFSPPIVPNLQVDRQKLFGGRYLAALFGSVLPGVEVTGITSNGFGLAIFRHGREIHFEPLQ